MTNMALKNPKHKALKNQAKELLRDMGYDDSEIYEEYKLVIKGVGDGTSRWLEPQKQLRVDVAGIKTTKRVAIECGNTPAKKIVWLKLFFDEVILMPHLKTFVTEEEKAIYQLGKLRENFKKKEQNYVKTINETRSKLDQTIQETEQMKKAIILALLDCNLVKEWDFEYNFRGKIHMWRTKASELGENAKI